MDFLINSIQFINTLIWETSFKTLFNIQDVPNQLINSLIVIPFIIYILIGSGIILGIKTRFVQFRLFRKGFKILKNDSSKKEVGLSPLSALLLGTATRVGSGNIVGVTTAIAIGGPGAIFWMWFSALVGMGLAFFEASFSQLYKTKDEDEYIGGLAFYFEKLMNSKLAGKIGAGLLILAFTLLIPSQAFNLLDSYKSIINNPTSPLVSSNVLIIITILIMGITYLFSANGSKGVSKVTDILVPIMAGIYILFVVIIIVLNFDKLPFFFSAVFGNAFSAKAAAGGIVGATLLQGIKRGLYSNEAGQGTTTMAAATAETKNPVEQGIVQTISVFIDTIIICTATAIPVVMANQWSLNASLDVKNVVQGLPLTISSFEALLASVPILKGLVVYILPISLFLFAYTTVLGQVSFAQMNFSFFNKNKKAKHLFTAALIVFTLGIGSAYYVTGAKMSDVFSISDISIGLLAVINVFVLVKYSKYISKALAIFEKDEEFTAQKIGIEDKDNFWNQAKK